MEDRKTDPSELGPQSTLPPGVTAIPDDVLCYILDEVRRTRSEISQEIHAMKIEVLAQLADLTLEALPRLQKLEDQAVKGFPVCKYHHSNGASEHLR